ncbi:Oidioi.mRNA.OKI2018_I69.PAR.g11694.t1.cds [Oikopleura dioica]|uniref:Oidioi.mRNA.OKI2018_I69.PAR.g11694.t1.cds n=1 Tax=Oikopleura dioica TaxID=34765 RepID=A0ABN7S378_OIKDI|nr:Oidioi.mRNA.OKI2018_I69.PAR.g11694.t1.cds [Oikopleura dioica]
MKLACLIFACSEAASVCYNDVGCFTDDPPFSVSGYRPRRLPKSPSDVLTGMFITNSKNRVERAITWNNVNENLFETNKKVVVMTHGWTDEYDDRSFMTKARDNYLNHQNVNFISVDWSKGSQNLDYFQSAADTQTVGRMIAKMLSQLSIRSSDFYCVGHSLGGHVCSYAAKYLKSEFRKTMGQVVGMDPAGPTFEKTTKEVRIDYTDATFVQIIHTNGGDEDAGFLGMNAAFGHADFYPNGGVRQPGCNNFICDHGEAPKMYVDSITHNGCNIPVCSKSNYEAGRCTNCLNGCNRLGWNVKGF